MPEYRLYYDANGKPITYTVENLPGNYITVTAQQYSECRMDVVVIAGQIVKSQRAILKMQKSNSGVRCNKYDINLLDENGIYWDLAAYERRNVN